MLIMSTTRSDGARVYGPAFRVLTLVSLACAYLLVVLGDTVRVTESGMGCRSWPLCNGSAGLSGSYHALLEQSHRYLATVVSVLVAVVFAVAWRRARKHRLVFRSASVALGLIGVQVLLGAITVFTHNVGWTVALHLAGAWLVVGAVTVTAVGVWRVPAPAAASRAAHVGRLGLAAAVSLFVLSVSGMLVLHDGASTACPGWPTCGRAAGPSGLVALQYLHRSFALIASALVVAAAIRAWRIRSGGLAGRALAGGAVALLAGTAALGGVVATTGAPPIAQDVHLAVASALWIAVVALAFPGVVAVGEDGSVPDGLEEEGVLPNIKV
jgi:heme A synthase